MMQAMGFRGASGTVHDFVRVAADSGWAAQAGVAVFAAAGAAGWRIIRIADMIGRPHDVQPIWAQADAARYGADLVLVMHEADPVQRRAVIADLEAGFSPLVTAPPATLAGVAVALAA